MSRSTSTKRGLRRAAMTVAALGALVMSSGVALLVTSGPANAATKVGVCHATSSDSNPYTFLSVDDDSVKFKGHLAHRDSPNKTWKAAGDFNGTPHAAGASKPDLIGSYTDDQGVFHLADGDITAASCEAAVVVVEATADVDFEDPTCANLSTPSYDPVGEHVTFSILSGSVAPDSDIVVRATADPGTTFDGSGTTQDFPHHFGPAVDLNAPPCAIVSPPDAAVATVTFEDPSCANGSTASYATDGTNVSFAVTDGAAAPGSGIEVTATADQGSEFADSSTEQKFTHTFGAAVDLTGPECVNIEVPVVDPPVVLPPVVLPPDSGITPTVVSAGLGDDLRTERGQALIGAGAVMLLAGAAGLRRIRVEA